MKLLGMLEEVVIETNLLQKSKQKFVLLVILQIPMLQSISKFFYALEQHKHFCNTLIQRFEP